MRRGYIRDIKGAKSHRRRLFFGLLSFSLLMQHVMVSVLRALAQQSVDEMTSSSSSCIDRFHCALEESLNKLSKTGLTLKELDNIIIIKVFIDNCANRRLTFKSCLKYYQKNSIK